MSRPYIRISRNIIPITYHHNPMHMIRHDFESVQTHDHIIFVAQK